MKKEFDLKIKGSTLESIKIDSSNSLMVATYTRDVAEFKNGDILIDAHDEAGAKYISIFKDINENKSDRFSAHLVFDIFYHCMIYGTPSWDKTENNRLATDEEKQLLFDALKKEGLKWNAEKLEIEKLASEFKRGDILASRTSTTVLVFDKYTRCDVFDSIINNSNAVSDNDWKAEIFRHASDEEIEVFYKALARMGKKWNAETLEVEKLDISEIVVDYESAIKYLGIQNTLLVFKSYDRVDKFNAQIKLQIIAEAWNKFDKFEADWENRDQSKYFPMFRVGGGKIEFARTSLSWGYLDFHTSNFSFKSEERARQFSEQFIDLFKIALGF